MADSLDGGAGNDILNGGSGKDTLLGRDGADFLTGATGQDQLDGGASNDVLAGGLDADQLFGGTDHDLLQGGGGSDVLVGGDGDDVLQGGGGNDQLEGQGGSDLLTGGAGRDRLVIGPQADPGAEVDTITDFADNDTLVLSDILSVAEPATGDELDDFLQFTLDGNDTTLAIDQEGGSGFDSPEATLVFQNADVTIGAPSQASLIDSLLANGQLEIASAAA